MVQRILILLLSIALCVGASTPEEQLQKKIKFEKYSAKELNKTLQVLDKAYPEIQLLTDTVLLQNLYAWEKRRGPLGRAKVPYLVNGQGTIVNTQLFASDALDELAPKLSINHSLYKEMADVKNAEKALRIGYLTAGTGLGIISITGLIAFPGLFSGNVPDATGPLLITGSILSLGGTVTMAISLPIYIKRQKGNMKLNRMGDHNYNILRKKILD